MSVNPFFTSLAYLTLHNPTPFVCRISDSSDSLQLSCGFLLLNHKSRGGGGGRKNSDLLIVARASCHATTVTAAVIGRALKHAAANLPAVIGSLCLAGQLCFISGFRVDSNFIFSCFCCFREKECNDHERASAEQVWAHITDTFHEYFFYAGIV